MEHKTWLWRKKSSDKTVIAADKGNEDEIQAILNGKAELQNDLKILHEKLSSVMSECNEKDDLVKKHEKTAQEAMEECQKAEEKVVSLKQELEKALEQRIAGEERLTHVDAALKECMQQLRFVREEQEQRVHDAVMKTSKEFENSQKVLEEKLADANKRLAKMGNENASLSKALLAKEKLIEDLSKQKSQAEANFNALMKRLESTEKDSASLRYEVRVLEKELEIRNEEREFNRRTADASHKQHLESVKKIAKLESECQRLRVLVRKRLPGPAAVAKMRNEVEALGRDSSEMRRRSNSNLSGFVADSAVSTSPESPGTKINFLAEQLCAMEEENKTLKEALQKRAAELQFSRAMYARTASKLSEVESHFDALSKVQAALEPSKSALALPEPSLASMSDVGSDDKASCAESWASALISELENFKHGKQRGLLPSKTVRTSDINLMDDFAEMERLAIVSVDNPSRSSHVSPDDANAIVSSLDTNLNGYSSEVKGREIVPISESVSSRSKQDESKDINKAPSWLQDIVMAVLEQTRVTRRRSDEILEDVRASLIKMNSESLIKSVDNRDGCEHSGFSKAPDIAGFISWEPANRSSGMDVKTDVDTLTDKGSQQFHTDLSRSICKIVELIEGITSSFSGYGTSETDSKKDGSFLSCKSTETTSGYMVRAFQWKISELSAVLQKFIQICYDLLNGKSDVTKFAHELSTALDWTINHCFSIQDVSSMREAIKKHFDWDESRSENESEVGVTDQFLHLPITASLRGNHNFEKCLPATIYETDKLKDQLCTTNSTRIESEEGLESAVDKIEFLTNQLQESNKTISMLQKEVETLKGSKATDKNQTDSHKLMKQDSESKLNVSKAEVNEVFHRISSLEVELDNKKSCCEELEATCLELQLQLESATKKATPSQEPHQEEKRLRTDWEISAASEKLAECQETILNLGKQLKALATPKEAALFDKVIPTNSESNTPSDTSMKSITLAEQKDKVMNQRSSLLERMLADDSLEVKDMGSPKIQATEKFSGSALVSNGGIDPLDKILVVNGNKQPENSVAVGSLALVPTRKRGVATLWRKLLWRKTKSYSKKPTLPFAP
ncbi:hypothetical protein K2173_006041 [Erythroxylum novogranatense]|uniref:Filament-like plant protein 7 n=1 Tax=Erythroxylum novogranatense TaxID=1862640 RepID=A0AAV8TBX0_9ROSI|nr:hypothetical protein K2173_006041 [Erythroxylum novogranatense]